MKSLFEFCIDNDPNPPNLIQELSDEGLIRSAIAEEGNESKLNHEEKQELKQRRLVYYGKEWIKTLTNFLPYKKLNFALVDQLTSITLQQDL